MGSAPELSSWYVSATLALAGWFLVFSVFKRYKNKIAYWL
jgi:hypothetical protein